jgi:hypothetical protein
VRDSLVCFLGFILMSCSSAYDVPANLYVGPGPFFDDADPGEDIVKVAPDPDKGFYWPYYLYVPLGPPGQAACRILVLPNNTAFNTDDMRFPDYRSYLELRMMVDSSYARDLSIPFLMPIFPRYRDKRYDNIYFHALDRDTLTYKGDPALERIDLQLVAMIKDAVKRLRERGFNVKPRVLMKGFSASGAFVSRFPALHPDIVHAAVAGSPGGVPISPVTEWEGKRLRYPIGVADVEELTGEKFKLAEFNRVRFYYHLGDQDVDNDPVYHRDCFAKEDENLIVELFGKTRPDRWPVSEKIYRSVGNEAIFRLYPGIGHRIGRDGHKEIIQFLKENL